MLGARARAAEYNAFKAASARQASREAEEHKLPPKAAPVSLSAFTKTAQLNRNKGAKAWKPLILEDTPEADDDNPEENEGTFSTPTRIRVVNSGQSVSEDTDMPLALVDAQSTRPSITTPSSVVPTARRGVLKVSQTPSSLINPTPQRVQPHSIVQQAQQGVAPSMDSSPSHYSGIGGYPYPRLTWWYDLHGMPVLVPAPMQAFEPSQYPTNFMVPDDISPTKQENKFTSLSHQYAGPHTGFMTSHQHFTPITAVVGNSLLPQVPTAHYSSDFSRTFVPQAHAFVPNPIQRPPMQQVNSKSVFETDGNVSDTSSFTVPNSFRPHSYPDAAGALAEKRSTTDRATRMNVQQATRPPTVPSSEEEPYDRKTKMESFVAAQQALAKTGKTVLHNPDLHRVRASEAASPARSGSSTTTPEHTTHNQMLSPGTVNILKPPPGFGPQPTARHLPEEDSDKKFSPLDDTTLRQIFEVDKEDWLELKPVTKAERMKMSRVMRIFGKAQSPDQPREFRSRTDTDRNEKLERWMQAANKDNKPATATRKLFEQAAKERLSSGNPNGLAVDGTRKNTMTDAEDDCAAICAVGDVVANLVDAAEPTDSDTLPYKYKPAPEYAIERGRLLMGSAGNTSFFDGNTSGFYNAPSRIARDPRSRPATKEAIKVKSEDDWKLRQDMYGRRRV